MGSNTTDGKPEGLETFSRLRGKVRLRDVLDEAIRMEQEARDFFSALEQQVDESLKPLIRDLAADERAHAELLVRLADDQSLELDRASIDPDVWGTVTLTDRPSLKPPYTAESILRYTASCESTAMRQYCALATITPKGRLRDAFMFLANEEAKHKLDLERRFYRPRPITR